MGIESKKRLLRHNEPQQGKSRTFKSRKIEEMMSFYSLSNKNIDQNIGISVFVSNHSDKA